MAVSEKVIMEAKREYETRKEFYGEYLEKWLKSNKELKPKIDRIDKWLKSLYKEEIREYISYLYAGYEHPIYSLSSEILSKQYSYDNEMYSYKYGYRDTKPEYQDLGSYLRERVELHYSKLFHDVPEIILAEDDIKYLQENISNKALERLLDRIEDYNANKKKDFNNTTDIIMCHTWDINHANGRYDDMIFGECMDRIETILNKYGFRRREMEVDRKCVKDTFTTNY